MPKKLESEFRLYSYIKESLKERGWNTERPLRGGHVFQQAEVQGDRRLGQALKRTRPDFTVQVGENQYWIIEAKSSPSSLSLAFKQAKKYAAAINSVKQLSCKLITVVTGTDFKSHYIETKCFFDGRWSPLEINQKAATGLLSREQAQRAAETGQVEEGDLNEDLFLAKISEINSVLHEGAINKRNRASVLASLLLALANDPRMSLAEEPSILINDINARAKAELGKYEKQNYHADIAIKKPASLDNHIKTSIALKTSISILRDLNITSAINGGQDVLGICYGQFLKYANDAKEIGIVLTPRHITTFAAEVVNIEKRDIVFDPTCGTGGFLVAALDKVRRESGDILDFKRGNLHGIEQDQMVATLAIVNMVFRGDGNSHIEEGNCFKKSPTSADGSPIKASKVLMNPPFALKEEREFHFVDSALQHLEEDGLLFAILPTTCMSNSKGAEVTWRQQLLMNHTLVAVVKMPPDLFKPIMKGTYGILLRAHKQHDYKANVLWALLHDGIIRSKTRERKQGFRNTEVLQEAIKNFLISGTKPKYIPGTLDCRPLMDRDDLSPERHIGATRKNPLKEEHFLSTLRRIDEGALHLKYNRTNKLKTAILLKKMQTPKGYPMPKYFALSEICTIERGASGRAKGLPKGDLPLISTSGAKNGITKLVKQSSVAKVYKNQITVSANGNSCCAHYHRYEFCANPDVHVVTLKSKKLNFKAFCIFLCGVINAESWRFDYYRKFSGDKFDDLKIILPVNKNNEIDLSYIGKYMQLLSQKTGQ